MSDEVFRARVMGRLRRTIADPDLAQDDPAKINARRLLADLEAGETIRDGGTILVSPTTGKVVHMPPAAPPPGLGPDDPAITVFPYPAPSTVAAIQIDSVTLHPSARKVGKDMAKWVARDDRVDFRFRTPWRKVAEYGAGRPLVDTDGTVLDAPVTEPFQLASWFTGLFLADLLAGRPADPQFLLLGLKHQLLRCRLHAARRLTRAAVSPTRVAIAFAYSWALGWQHECAVLASEFDRIAGYDTEELDDGSVVRLMMELRRQNTGQWPNGFTPTKPLVAGYQSLLDTVTGPDPAAFSAATEAAAEFHISRAREHTSKQTYEFVDELDRVFAAEILAAIAFRRARGLPIPEFSHPMVRVSLQVFDALPPYRPDPLFEAVLARLPRDLPNFR